VQALMLLTEIASRASDRMRRSFFMGSFLG
jgi:hypothetical protein